MSQIKAKKPVHPVYPMTVDGVPVLSPVAKAGRLKAADPARICNTSVRARYTGGELSAPCLREHADDALALPSRMGERLCYRGGYVTDMGGIAITSAQS